MIDEKQFTITYSQMDASKPLVEIRALGGAIGISSNGEYKIERLDLPRGYGRSAADYAEEIYEIFKNTAPNNKRK